MLLLRSGNAFNGDLNSTILPGGILIVGVVAQIGSFSCTLSVKMMFKSLKGTSCKATQRSVSLAT